MSFRMRRGRASFSLSSRGPRVGYRVGCLVPAALFTVVMLTSCSSSSLNATGTTPSASPTIEPTAAPPPSPTPTDRPALPVTITSITSPIDAGKMARVSAKTTIGATCSITVTYESQESTAKGLEPKKAPANGTITWTWLVGANTNPGTRAVDVECELGDAIGDANRDLVVR